MKIAYVTKPYRELDHIRVQHERASNLIAEHG